MSEKKACEIQAASKSTGPRTQVGKRRSKNNALKSGLFAKTILVSGESLSEYNSLHRSIWEEFQPESPSEVEDVENLVNLFWRRRRVPKAESAEIAKIVGPKSFESMSAQMLEAQDVSQAGKTAGGLLRHTSNPFVLKNAIELLEMCRSSLDKYGFEGDDMELLQKLYGLDHDGTVPFGPFHMYVLQLKRARGTNTGFQNEYDKLNKSPDEVKKDMLLVFDKEIERLKFLEAAQLVVGERMRNYEALAASVPPQDVLNRICVVEAHLSREIDRTLNRLERARRRRLGQPGPPTVRLELND